MKIIKSLTIVLLASISFSSLIAYSKPINASSTPVCSNNPLGLSSDFGLFVKNDIVQSGSDTGGRVAAGNSITLDNYDVGATLHNSNGTRDDLVAGNTIKFTNGSVDNGNIKYGQSSNIFNVSVPNGTSAQGNVIDFNTQFSNLVSESNYISALNTNGSTTVIGKQIILAGSDANINIFSVSSSLINNSSELILKAPVSSTIVINFTGNNFTFVNYGFTLNGNYGSKILYNFNQGSAIDLKATGLRGSILAPNASINFNNANVKGAIIAGNLYGNGETDMDPFSGCIVNPSPVVTTTPQPTSTIAPITITVTSSPQPTITTTIVVSTSTIYPTTSKPITTTTSSAGGAVLGAAVGGDGNTGSVQGASNSNINGLANTGISILVSTIFASFLVIVLAILNNKSLKRIFGKFLKR